MILGLSAEVDITATKPIVYEPFDVKAKTLNRPKYTCCTSHISYCIKLIFETILYTAFKMLLWCAYKLGVFVSLSPSFLCEGAIETTFVECHRESKENSKKSKRKIAHIV